MDHEYAPIHGIDSYIKKSVKLAYGEDSRFIKENRLAAAQSISGTGSIRLGFEFVKYFSPYKNAAVYTPDPTWPIHKTACGRVGVENKSYRYYHRQNKTIDITGMLEDLDKAKEGDVVVLHVCAHNPTGCDPSKEQWSQILEVVKRKKLLACFDSAY